MTESAETTQLPRRGGLARNALHLGFGQVITTALTMVLSALIARTLGASEFGIVYLITAIANFAYVFVDWGHGPYVTRAVALDPRRSGDLMGSVLLVRAATALLMAVLVVAITGILEYDTRTQLLAGALILAQLPQYLGLTFSWAFRGHERMEYDALIQIVLKFSMLVLTLAFFARGGRLQALLAAYLIAGAITFAAAVWLYKRLRFPPLRASRATARQLVHEGAPMLAISLAIAVQPYIDANILYKLSPSSVIGWFGAAWVIAGTLVAPATILGATLYPRLSRVAGDADAFAHALRTAFRPLLLVAVLGAVGTYLFADFAVGLIYGAEKFGPAADILRAFAPALMLIYIDMLLGYAILAMGRAGPLAKAKLLAVAVTTAMELALVPLFQARAGNGGIGVVLAMGGGELVMVIAAVWLMRGIVTAAMAADALRGLAAGAATMAVIRALPPFSPLLGIPVCVALLGAFSIVVRLVGLRDVHLLLPGKRASRAENSGS